MDNIITLVLGDPSGDGHGQSESINIASNFNANEITNAYKLGTKKLGFDFCNEVCSEYEDNLLNSRRWNKLKKLGYQNKVLEEEISLPPKKGKVFLWTDSFTDIYLFILNGKDTLSFSQGLNCLLQIFC